MLNWSNLFVCCYSNRVRCGAARREADIDSFLAATREKFVGFAVRGDRRSMAGLPAPLSESLAVLERHLYVPLAEAQVARETELLKFPLSKVRFGLSTTERIRIFSCLTLLRRALCAQGVAWAAAEVDLCEPLQVLYRHLLPHISQAVVCCAELCTRYVQWCKVLVSLLVALLQVALLKILLAAVPVSKSKSDSLNVLHEMLPPEMPYAPYCTVQ